jgi:hypothetical protein
MFDRMMPRESRFASISLVKWYRNLTNGFVMPSLVLKDLPKHVHKRLKEEAVRNRRSMTQQAVHILEHALRAIPPVELPPPIKPLRRITGKMVLDAIHEGRR